MTASAPDKELSVSQVNKKANWVTVSLPRALVRDLRATAHNLDLSVVQLVHLAYLTYIGSADTPAPVPAPAPSSHREPPPPEPARPDAVQVGRFVYPKKG